MQEVVALPYDQYQLVMNILNLSLAVFGGFALLFAMLRSSVAPSYRIAVALMSAVMAIAAYVYFRLYQNWDAAFLFKGGQYAPSGQPLNDSIRLVDWVGTIPLMMAALVLVLDLGREKSASLVTRLVVASLLMVGFGYVGEMTGTDMVKRITWGLAACLPFGYIMMVLWHEMSQMLSFESDRVRQLFGQLRWLVLVCWLFYPIVYALPIFGLGDTQTSTLLQLSYSVADLVTKAGFGLMIFAIAREKSEENELMAGEYDEEFTAQLNPAD